MENSMEFLQKIQNRVAMWFCDSSSECTFEENENTNLKRYMHPNVHSHCL